MKEDIIILINKLDDNKYTSTLILNKIKNITSTIIPPIKPDLDDVLELTINEYKTLPMLIKANYEIKSIVIKKSE